MEKEENKEPERKENHHLGKEKNKVMKLILIGAVVVVVAFFLGLAFMRSLNKMETGNTSFEKISAGGGLYFYKTTLPITFNEKEVNLDVYLRTNPKVLEKIPFEGEKIELMELLVLNTTDEFRCNGDGAIAVGNVVSTFGYLGSRLGLDPNATCDSQGRYTFVEIDVGDETKVVQNDETCYTITIKDCEILKGTERLIQLELDEINSARKK